MGVEHWHLAVDDVVEDTEEVARGCSKMMCKEERDKKIIRFIHYGDKKQIIINVCYYI